MLYTVGALGSCGNPLGKLTNCLDMLDCLHNLTTSAHLRFSILAGTYAATSSISASNFNSLGLLLRTPTKKTEHYINSRLGNMLRNR